MSQQPTIKLMLLTALVIGLAASQIAVGESTESPLVHLTGTTMGPIVYNVKLSSLPQQLDAQTIQSEIDTRLDRIEDQMSTYRDQSELSRFNRHQGTDWFAVSRETAQVVDAALRISRLTKGAFDPTVGPLVQLWNFGSGACEFKLPTSESIEKHRARVGFEMVDVRLTPPALRKNRNDIELDLSAIAKGFAVDTLADYLDHLQFDGYLVEIGGEMRVKGNKPDGSGWVVGIETPTSGRREVTKGIELANQAIATSGDYRNYFEHAGKRYSHMIDPRTGRPVEHQLASVSIICDTCMEADALATAVMVLGPKSGFEFAVREQLVALLIVRTDSGFTEKATPLFRQQFLDSQDEPHFARTFLAVLVVFGIAVVGMAAGVILGKRRLRGSCGGLAGLRDANANPMCDVCTTPSESCKGVEDTTTASPSTAENG